MEIVERKVSSSFPSHHFHVRVGFTVFESRRPNASLYLTNMASSDIAIFTSNNSQMLFVEFTWADIIAEMMTDTGDVENRIRLAGNRRDFC